MCSAKTSQLLLLHVLSVPSCCMFFESCWWSHSEGLVDALVMKGGHFSWLPATAISRRATWCVNFAISKNHFATLVSTLSVPLCMLYTHCAQTPPLTDILHCMC